MGERGGSQGKRGEDVVGSGGGEAVVAGSDEGGRSGQGGMGEGVVGR